MPRLAKKSGRICIVSGRVCTTCPGTAGVSVPCAAGCLVPRCLTVTRTDPIAGHVVQNLIYDDATGCWCSCAVSLDTQSICCVSNGGGGSVLRYLDGGSTGGDLTVSCSGDFLATGTYTNGGTTYSVVVTECTSLSFCGCSGMASRITARIVVATTPAGVGSKIHTAVTSLCYSSSDTFGPVYAGRIVVEGTGPFLSGEISVTCVAGSPTVTWTPPSGPAQTNTAVLTSCSPYSAVASGFTYSGTAFSIELSDFYATISAGICSAVQVWNPEVILGNYCQSYSRMQVIYTSTSGPDSPKLDGRSANLFWLEGTTWATGGYTNPTFPFLGISSFLVYTGTSWTYNLINVSGDPCNTTPVAVTIDSCSPFHATAVGITTPCYPGDVYTATIYMYP